MPASAGWDDPDASRRRFEALLHSVGDGVYGTDGSGVITFANAAAAKLLGYRVDELVGKDAHDLLHRAHPDGSPYSSDDCPETATRRDGTVHHVRGGEALWRKDGRALQVELITSPLPASDGKRGVLTTFRGTNAGDRLEQDLAESDERFRRLWEASLDAIGISENGRFVDVNPRFEALFGYRREEVLGKPVVDIVAAESRELVARQLRSNIEGGYEFVAIRKDGSRVRVEVNARAIASKGRQARVASMRDISDHSPGPTAISRAVVRRIVQDLTEAGVGAHQTLLQAGRKLAEDTTAKDLDAFVAAFAGMGLGELKVERQEEGRFSFTGGDLFEKRDGARAATCYFTLGFLSGVASRLSRDQPTLGTEIECQSRGSPACRFVVQVRKPEEGLARRVKELV